MSSIEWRKSSRSDPNNCVELAWPNGQAAIRDSKNPNGPALSLDRSTLIDTIRAVKGEGAP